MFLRAVIYSVKLGIWLKLCPCGMFKFTGAAGDTSKPKENGDDHNSGKMSVILVEGVS